MLVLACLLRPFSFYENLAARKKERSGQLPDSITEPESDRQRLINNNELRVEVQCKCHSLILPGIPLSL